jgi:hypothetical protein
MVHPLNTDNEYDGSNKFSPYIKGSVSNSGRILAFVILRTDFLCLIF